MAGSLSSLETAEAAATSEGVYRLLDRFPEGAGRCEKIEGMASRRSFNLPSCLKVSKQSSVKCC